MKFVVCEDLADASETRVHATHCPNYANRQKEATTMRWHGPFDTRHEADERGKTIAATKRHGCRDAGCCLS